MRYHRWTHHRFNDGRGRTYRGRIPINLLWIAAAAAEETLQGSPLAAAWLGLFRSQLSSRDAHWLRWAGDLAESAELRRAYSGLYGRFFARALLQQHLGFTSFLSLRRHGLTVRGSVDVRRSALGDIPDWLGWCPARQRHVLAEAKGSLTGGDFLGAGEPSCVREGKKQFGRVEVFAGATQIRPLQWVAATRWATDVRPEEPVTILWDPPVDDVPFSPREAMRHQQAMQRAWLTSIAPGFALKSATDFTLERSAQRALVILAEPGGMEVDISEEQAGWSDPLPKADGPVVKASSDADPDQPAYPTGDTEFEGPDDGDQPLKDASPYEDGRLLRPGKGQTTLFSDSFIAVAVTKFGILQVRNQAEVDALLRLQERIRKGDDEPAMVVGIPLVRPEELPGKPTWNDAAGLAQSRGVSVFDLSRVEIALHPL
jgi:hypothetical protein